MMHACSLVLSACVACWQTVVMHAVVTATLWRLLSTRVVQPHELAPCLLHCAAVGLLHCAAVGSGGSAGLAGSRYLYPSVSITSCDISLVYGGRKASRQHDLCCHLVVQCLLCRIIAKPRLSVATLAGAALCSTLHTVSTPLVVLLDEQLHVAKVV